jgi:hypothetical protein
LSRESFFIAVKLIYVFFFGAVSLNRYIASQENIYLFNLFLVFVFACIWLYEWEVKLRKKVLILNKISRIESWLNGEKLTRESIIRYAMFHELGLDETAEIIVFVESKKIDD